MSKHLESLYQNLLNGTLPHNLSWAEAVELVEHGPGEPERALRGTLPRQTSNGS